MKVIPVARTGEFVLPSLGIAFPVIRLGAVLVGDHRELLAVVGATRLNAGTESRQFHSAERLTVDDGSCDATVDIEIPSHDGVAPQAALVLVECLDTRCKAIVQTVDQVDGLLQRVEGGHRQHGSEQLGAE